MNSTSAMADAFIDRPHAQREYLKRFNHTYLLVFTIGAAISFCVLHAAPVDAFTFPDEYHIGEDTLTLRGTGLVRELLFIKVVTAALYVQDGTPVEQVLSDVGKRVEMLSFRTIPADDFIREAEIALAENVPATTIDVLRPRLNQLHQAYEDLKPGDRYAITYLPNSGTYLELNGKLRVSIEGADFSAAYFQVWLGDKPIHKKLKAQLVGGR
jgi:hypothetical protein